MADKEKQEDKLIWWGNHMAAVRNVILSLLAIGISIFFLADFFRVPGRVDTLEEGQINIVKQIDELRVDVRSMHEQLEFLICVNKTGGDEHTCYYETTLNTDHE